MYLQKKILYKFLFVLINAPTNILCVCVFVFNALEEDSSEQEKYILSRLQKYLSECAIFIWKSCTGGVFDEKLSSLVSSLNTFVNRICNCFLLVFCIQVSLVISNR